MRHVHNQSAAKLSARSPNKTALQVITRLKRAALCCRWSPCGCRFAIGGAAGEASVCFTEEANDWWGAALIRGHGSAVTGVAWHPDGDTLATICADGVCRVFQADPAGVSPS